MSDIKKGDYIFCYGTLRVGERADLSANKSQWGVSHVGEDKIEGDIFDTGNGYPGLKVGDPACRRVVVGDLFLVRDESIGAVLDAYEGYPYLYDRRQVETSTGRAAWVYTYNHDVTDDQHIASGDWRHR